LYDKAIYKQAASTVSIPRPRSGEPLRDVALLAWCAEVLANLVPAV